VASHDDWADDGAQEPFGHLPGTAPVQPVDELLDPRVAGSVLPVRPPSSASAIPHRYRRSASASVLAAGLLGLREVVDPVPRDDEVVLEQPASPTDDDGPIEVYLDPDDPSASIVVIRDPHDLN
jgi:hypothetical protein